MSRTIEWHDTLDSTMTRAALLASEGCASGTIVAARSQSAGIGRHGHSWDSPTGGLYFTAVLRPALEPAHLPVVTLALGLAVADALQLFAGLAVDLRWPNDVMVGDRKLAGILTQLHDGAVLAGIGLNVGQSAFPPDLRTVATSLLLETGTAHNPDLLLKAIAASIDTHVQILASSGVDAILRLFTAASSYAAGRRVRVDLPTGETTGTTAGLTPEGALVLLTDQGSTVVVTAGGVRPLED